MPEIVILQPEHMKQRACVVYDGQNLRVSVKVPRIFVCKYMLRIT